MYLYNLYIFFKNRLIIYSNTKEMDKNSKRVIEKCSGEKILLHRMFYFVFPQKQSLRQGFDCMSLVKRYALRKRKSQHKKSILGSLMWTICLNLPGFLRSR